jgi:protein-S-isoprenylcysteine O-methyltransferase Ste14
VFVAAILVYMDPHWFWPGLVISATGMVLQVWVLGGERSRKTLAIDGPYLFVRNPTYIARFFYVLGLLLMIGTPWVLMIFIPLFVLYTVNRVSQWEPSLHDQYGTRYLRYSRQVPCYLPGFKPYPEGRFWFFNMKSFRRQYGEIFVVLSLVLYAACYLAAFNLR